MSWQKNHIKSKIKLAACDSQILHFLPDVCRIRTDGSHSFLFFRLFLPQCLFSDSLLPSTGSSVVMDLKTWWESSIKWLWLASWLAKSFPVCRHTMSVSDTLDSLWSSLNTCKVTVFWPPCLYCDRGMGSGLRTEATCWSAASEIFRF